MKRRMAALLTTAGAALATFASVVPAHAFDYVSDTCGYQDKSYCFGIFYNSASNGVSTSPCFLSSQSIDDHYGVNSPNGNIISLYQFGWSDQYLRTNLGGSHCEANSEGSGYALKNDAASVVNGDAWASYTVFYNSNFNGTAQTFDPNSNGNLISRLHNNNASHRRNG